MFDRFDLERRPYSNRSFWQCYLHEGQVQSKVLDCNAHTHESKQRHCRYLDPWHREKVWQVWYHYLLSSWPRVQTTWEYQWAFKFGLAFWGNIRKPRPISGQGPWGTNMYHLSQAASVRETSDYSSHWTLHLHEQRKAYKQEATAIHQTGDSKHDSHLHVTIILPSVACKNLFLCLRERHQRREMTPFPTACCCCWSRQDETLSGQNGKTPHRQGQRSEHRKRHDAEGEMRNDVGSQQQSDKSCTENDETESARHGETNCRNFTHEKDDPAKHKKE